MARLLPHVTLAIIGSGALFVTQVGLNEHCAEAQLKALRVSGTWMTLLCWWAALACAINFSLKTGAREQETAARALFKASLLTAASASVGFAFELVTCDLELTKTLGEFVVLGFMFTAMATPFALMWRVIRDAKGGE